MNDMRRRSVSAHAASAAFFLFLSLVPTLIMLFSLLPYTPLTREELVAAVVRLTPDALDLLVEQVVGEVYRKSTGIFSVAALVTLWSAGKGVMALMNGLNAIAGVEERRGYFVVRLVSSFHTLVILMSMLAGLFFIAFGSELMEWLTHEIPWLAGLGLLRAYLQVIFVWLVLWGFFGVIYTYIPSGKRKFREQRRGAAFTAAAWSLFSWGFSWYLDAAGSYNIYGSLSLVVLMMLWLYYGVYIVLIGAYLNQRRVVVICFENESVHPEPMDTGSVGRCSDPPERDGQP